jgi:hypothetical protein
MCDLYPDELYQLHCDLDAFANGHVDEGVYDRLPASLAEAEALADSLLEGHLRVTLEEIGQEEYFRLLVGAASEDAKLLYALRCFIACSGITPKPDRIEIFDNKVDLSVRSSEPDYNLSLEEKFRKNYEKSFGYSPGGAHRHGSPDGNWRNSASSAVKVENHVVSDRDVLPWGMLPKFRDILDGFGLEVTGENVWGLLSEHGRRASVRDRIIGRLLYLVENARSRDRGIVGRGVAQLGSAWAE